MLLGGSSAVPIQPSSWRQAKLNLSGKGPQTESKELGSLLKKNILSECLEFSSFISPHTR